MPTPKGTVGADYGYGGVDWEDFKEWCKSQYGWSATLIYNGPLWRMYYDNWVEMGRPKTKQEAEIPIQAGVGTDI